MVSSAPAPGVGSSKRPASCMQDDINDRDNVPTMGLSVRSSINIPYAHYAMIYLDNMGRLKMTESPSIQEQNGTVFTTEVCERFLEILGAKIGYQRPMVRRLSGAGATPYSYDPQQLFGHLPYRQTKRGRNSPAHSMYGVPPSIQFSVPVEETPSCGSVDMVGLEIGDTPKVLDYYKRSLMHFQQLNCRQIAKAFIKFIEPRKQVNHPYNGRKPRAGTPRGKKGDPEKTDPEKTKPEWWPADVVHKEPDHLRKDQRLSLLIHIICKLGITADQLQDIAHECKRWLRHPDKLPILDEVFGVRRMEERYERGEVDANTIVYVVNRGSNPKEKDAESNVDPDQKHEQVDDNVDEALPIHHSDVNSTSLMSSSVEHIGMAAPSRPMNMGDDRNQLFPLPESLASFDPWIPTFRHNFFNPMAHNTAPSDALSQATMSYQLPRSPTSHPQEMPHMAHGLPNLPQDRPLSMDSMSIRGPSFRTGSLSHPCDPSQQPPPSSCCGYPDSWTQNRPHA